jgi:hypothetical protein
VSNAAGTTPPISLFSSSPLQNPFPVVNSSKVRDRPEVENASYCRLRLLFYRFMYAGALVCTMSVSLTGQRRSLHIVVADSLVLPQLSGESNLVGLVVLLLVREGRQAWGDQQTH